MTVAPGNAPDIPTEFSAARIKHLEFVQTIISRQAGNSFLLKGWALTVAAALYGFAASHLNWRIATIGFLPAIAFWLLDAYFLRQERLFRCLYDDIRKADTCVGLFSMNTQPYKRRAGMGWRKVIFSYTLAIFYGMIVLVGIAVLIASVFHGASSAHACRTKASTLGVTCSAQGSAGGHILPM